MAIQFNTYSAYRLEDLRGRNDIDAIKTVAKEMESLFAYELVKAMRQNTSLTKGSLGQDIYMSMFDIEIARLIAEKGLGLQDIIIKNLQRYKDTTISKESENEKLEDNTISESAKFPVTGEITSTFGMRRHPVFGDYRFHNGIDIAAKEGTPVFPVMTGRVIFSGEAPGYGNMVVIDHLNGYKTVYAHNKANFVKEGDEVDASTVIATVGSSGISTGPHLHFEVKYRDERINPLILLAMNKENAKVNQ